MDMYLDNMPERALAWHRAGLGAVLATVVDTWGSAPRRVGAQLAIDGTGRFEGSVSGGCVEGAVVLEALEALADGAPRVLEYGVSDADAFAVGLACGGRIRVLVEPVGAALPEDMLADIVKARAARRALAYQVGLSSWERWLRGPDAPDIEARFRGDRSGLEGMVFTHIHNPPLRMVVVGAVHITQALVPMAQMAGYDVTLIDPRAGFANGARFPGIAVLDDWPDVALAGLGLDARSAVVALTHDPKLDDPALIAALATPAFYIGALGSTRSHAKRAERLAVAGAAFARIHGPVGLDIGAATPAEIALSIMAQVTAVLRQKV
jgi:xanthine dehydrogenase accessory factor